MLVLALGLLYFAFDKFIMAPRQKAAAAAASESVDAKSVAVLPFADLSQAKDQEYFSDGMSEELLNLLANVPGLHVVGRTSSFAFKGKNEDLRTIGEKLGVAHILEGSVRKSGKRVRITAQLVKAADGFHLWSETYDRTLDDIFAVQGEISKAVAQELRVSLLGPAPVAKRPDSEAYDLVLQARFALLSNTAETAKRAKDVLERAIKLSPDYAPAWAEMGLAYWRDVERAVSTDQSLEAMRRARAACTKALQLDPNLALARSRLAAAQQYSWEFADAELSTAMALAASPKDSLVLGNAAIIYSNVGRFSEANRLGEESLGLDPLRPFNYMNVGTLYMIAGRPEDAERSYLKAIELQPENPQMHYALGSYYLDRGLSRRRGPSFRSSSTWLGSASTAASCTRLSSNRRPATRRRRLQPRISSRSSSGQVTRTTAS